jgi:hypothetical protein
MLDLIADDPAGYAIIVLVFALIGYGTDFTVQGKAISGRNNL